MQWTESSNIQLGLQDKGWEVKKGSRSTLGLAASGSLRTALFSMNQRSILQTLQEEKMLTLWMMLFYITH